MLSESAYAAINIAASQATLEGTHALGISLRHDQARSHKYPP
jgi:hypothetical protein